MVRNPAMAFCHPDEFHYKKGLCKGCYAEYKLDPSDQFLIEKTSEERKKRKYSTFRYENRPPEYFIKKEETRLKNSYGITVEERQELLNKQNGRCAICAKTPEEAGKTPYLTIDHNHETGAVRELLCVACNLMLGKIESNRVSIQKFLVYIEKHNEIKYRL